MTPSFQRTTHKEHMHEHEQDIPPFITGKCLCGAVTWSSSAPPSGQENGSNSNSNCITVCHCDTCCRSAPDKHPIAWTSFPNSALRWCWSSSSSQHGSCLSPTTNDQNDDFKKQGEEGEESNTLIERYPSSPLAIRGSCKICKTPLFMKYHCRPETTDVNMGLVVEDHPSRLHISLSLSLSSVGTQHIFVRDRIPVQDSSPSRERCWSGFDEGMIEKLRAWERDGRPLRDDI